MIEIDLPKGWSNPRIVTGYNGEIRLMVSLETEIQQNWTHEQSELLKQKKIEYLEKAIGYKIQPLDEIVKHDDYEKMWAKYIEEEKQRKTSNV